jgi:hypothetical protein
MPPTTRDGVVCPNRRFLFTKQKRCFVNHIMENKKSSGCETNPVMTITFARFQVPAAANFRSPPDVWATRFKALTGRPMKIGPIPLSKKNQQNAHIFFINNFMQLYCLRHVSKTTKCSSSGRLVHAVLWYFFHASVLYKQSGRCHNVFDT